MASQIRDLRPQYPVIEFVVQGSFAYDESLAVVAEGTRLQEAEGILLGLVDATRVVHATATQDVLALANEVARVGRPAGWKQAFIRPEDTFAAMSVSFYETAARNRGLDVRVFADRQEALDWLMDGVAEQAT